MQKGIATYTYTVDLEIFMLWNFHNIMTNFYVETYHVNVNRAHVFLYD